MGWQISVKFQSIKLNESQFAGSQVVTSWKDMAKPMCGFL